MIHHCCDTYDLESVWLLLDQIGPRVFGTRDGLSLTLGRRPCVLVVRGQHYDVVIIAHKLQLDGPA